MTPDELRQLIADRLAEFYSRRLQRLNKLTLKYMLSRKNPYLFRAIGTPGAPEFIEGLLRAYLISSDEGLFGDVFFEPVAKAVSGGVVATAKGVDIAIETDRVYKAISVKSGPNPFNSSQVEGQKQQFEVLRQRLLKLHKQFDPILGHAYGRISPRAKAPSGYRRLAGQAFWEELTGDPDFYLSLIRLMDVEVIKKHRKEYESAWATAKNRHLRQFMIDFCDEAGEIQWEAVVKFNSGT